MDKLLALVISLPKMLERCEKLVSWIIEKLREMKSNQDLEELKAALEEAKKTKDTSKLDQLLNPQKDN